MSIAIEVTKEAQSQVRELIKSQKPGMAVRVFVQQGGGGGCGSGGGCGGGCSCGSEGGGGAKSVSFGMAFDKPRSGDEVVQIDGFSVVVDSMTASEVDGAKIDFVQSLDASGFQIVSPKTALHQDAPGEHAGGGGGCGCGSGGGGGGGCC
jgi:Fe-S cluster assembly iron-binding protein IscA